MGLQRAGASTPDTVGRYRLIRAVAGRPGLWTAQHRQDGELAIVHAFPGNGRGNAMLAEARRALELDHPCVVRVRSADLVGSDVLVGTDYVDHESYPSLLDAARDQGRPITLKVTLRVVCDVLAGLSAMHGAAYGARPERIIFGRMTPDDIFVGADGLSRVDVGARQARSVSARWIGYFAPEVVLAGDTDADERTDVYAAGVVLWEALAQQRLYDVPSIEALHAAQTRGYVPAPPLPDDAPWAEGVISVAMRAVAVDPKDRYVSAAAMLEALLEAAGRRVGTAGDIIELVESVVGPFIRARRREASQALHVSDSDIRATEPDREENTLTARDDEDGDIPTEVDFNSPLKKLVREMAAGKIPKLHTDDPDEVPTDQNRFDPGAHPADEDKPTRQAEGGPVSTQRPTYAEDPSITSTLPPAVKRELIAKQAAMGEGEDTITKSVSPIQDVVALDQDLSEARTAVDDSVSVSVPTGRVAAMRPASDSIVTLDMPTKVEDDREASLVTARRVSPNAPQLTDEEVEEELAATTNLDRSALPRNQPVIVERPARSQVPTVPRPSATVRSAGEDASIVEQTLDMGNGARRGQPVMKTVPFAMPTTPIEGRTERMRPTDMLRAAGTGMPAQSPYPPQIALPQRPPPHPAHMAPPAPPISAPHQAVAPVVIPPQSPPPIVAPPAAMSSTPSLPIVEERQRSSVALGFLTFFLVLGSLVILAWLTFPYWRGLANL